MRLTGPAVFRSTVGSISLCLTIFLLLSVLLVQPVSSAEGETSAEKPKAPAPVVVAVGPEDDFGRGVPRTSVRRFLDAAKNKDYTSAAQHLDLRNLPRDMRGKAPEELAREFKIILDRGLWIDLDLLSDHPEGHQKDGLPSFRDLLGKIETDEKTYTLLLQRVPREDGVSIWKVSNLTVAKIPELYELAGFGNYGDFLSSIFPEVEIMGAYLWQWVGVLINMVFAYLILLPLSWLAVFLINRKGKRPQVTRFIKGPAYFLVWVLIITYMVELLSPTVTLQALVKASTFLTIAVAWVLMRLFDFYVEYQVERFKERDKSGAIVLLRPLTTIVRVLIIITALLVWMDNIGFKVTTLMAGLGVGGIAIALAAQAIFADIIGTVILLVSQPVSVDDVCKFGNTFGIVEEIGLRATRIRTLDNTLVSVPNGEFSKLHLENYTKREKVWFHPKISLPYETSKDTIREIAGKIEKMLQSHPEVLDEPIHVYFLEIGDYSHNIDIFSYVNTGDYGKYKKIAEELNYGIMEIVEKAGARLALPSRKMYMDENFDKNENET